MLPCPSARASSLRGFRFHTCPCLCDAGNCGIKNRWRQACCHERTHSPTHQPTNPTTSTPSLRNLSGQYRPLLGQGSRACAVLPPSLRSPCIRPTSPPHTRRFVLCRQYWRGDHHQVHLRQARPEPVGRARRVLTSGPTHSDRGGPVVVFLVFCAGDVVLIIYVLGQ